MDIYFDAESLVKYLSELRIKIKRENEKDNNSIFNISPRFFIINETLGNQRLLFDIQKRIDNNTDLSEKEQDVDFSKESRSANRDLIIKAMQPYIPNYEEDKEEKNADKLEFIDNWIKDHKGSIIFFNSDDVAKDDYTPYFKESALSLIPTLDIGHCLHSRISLDNMLENFAKVFFVDNDLKPHLNKTFYTRSLNNWTPLSDSMRNESDIIIVDAYLFEGAEDVFGHNAEILIKNICGKGKKERKNIVLFFESTYPIWLYEFNKKITEDEGIDCQITFVGVPKDAKKLHDRFIISNHRLIFSGHSFSQYFNGDRFSANGSVCLSIGSSADINNEEVIIQALEYLNKEVLNTDGVRVYGEEKRIMSNLLITNNVQTDVHVFGDLEIDLSKIYNFRSVINPKWDNNLNTLYWNDIQIAGKKDLAGKSVRLCNITENTNNNGKYRWFAHYRLKERNDD